MTKILKLSVMAFILSAASLEVFAQEKPEPKEKKESNDIIIHKKGDTNEKLTIVIDGNKVTVNGKPVEDYKSEDVDIIRGGEEPFAFNAPMIPQGNLNLMDNDFMREVHSNKAFLGVMTKEGDGGAEITDVTKESPAEKAGLKQGDVITKINNDKIDDADDLYKAIGQYKPGEKVNVTYKRDGKENTVSVELTENKQVRVYSWKNGDNDNYNYNFNFKTPQPPYIHGWNGDMFGDRPRLGIQVQDTEDGKGVKVLEVEDDETADKAGLKEDDIITQINGKNVTSVDDLKDAMKSAKKGDTVKITYTRNGKSQTADVKFPKELKTTDL